MRRTRSGPGSFVQLAGCSGETVDRTVRAAGRLCAALSLLVGLAPSDGVGGGRGSPPAPGAHQSVDCALTGEQIAWIQKLLDGWERVSRDILRVGRSGLPWSVLFDSSCAWHLAPDTTRLTESDPAHVSFTLAKTPVPARLRPHASGVWLPSGLSMPPQEAAFASVYESPEGGTAPFFVLALPEIWRERFPGEGHLEEEILGVASHEMVHALQLEGVARRVDELERQYSLPEDLDDDIIERRFGDVAEFAEAYEAETDLFYRAGSETDDFRARVLAARALESAREREKKHFTGDDAVYRELDALFLNMEGVAVWAAYRLSRLDSTYDIGIEDPAADRKRNAWSQDRGLALFLLIDRWIHHWRVRVLGRELASPYRLLREELGLGR